MRAHASQMGPDHFLLAMPDPLFAMRYGRRVLHRRPVPPGGHRRPFEELFNPCDSYSLSAFGECVAPGYRGGAAFDGG